MTEETSAHFKDYIGLYLSSYFGFLILIMLINVFIYELPSTASGMATVMGSVSLVASKFTNKHKRLFTKQEKRNFALGSFATCMAVSTIIAAIILSAMFFADPQDEMLQNLEKVKSWIWAIGIIFIGSIYYFAHLFAYGTMNKSMLKQLQKAKPAKN